MSKNRITEKQLHNKRFRKTEETIIIAFLSAREKLSADRLIKIAGISRSTLYRHHKTVYEIAPDYEQYILNKSKRLFRHLAKRESIANIYRRMLIFLAAHSQIIQFLFRYGSQNIIENIIFLLEPKISATGKVVSGEMFIIYAKEVAGIVEEWASAGFDKSQVFPIVNKIIYLTDTARARLGPITKH